jgi:hypothetical protein
VRILRKQKRDSEVSKLEMKSYEELPKLASEGLGFVRWQGAIDFKSGAYTKYVSILKLNR